MIGEEYTKLVLTVRITIQYNHCMDDVFSKIAKQFDLALIVQFGSTVKGGAGPMSDTDVLVNGGRELSLRDEAELRAALAQALEAKEDQTDLVFLHRASPLLAYEALWQGVLRYGDIETLHINQVRAWKRLQEDRKFARRRRAFIEAALVQPAPVI